jgi:hypothetical protein
MQALTNFPTNSFSSQSLIPTCLQPELQHINTLGVGVSMGLSKSMVSVRSKKMDMLYNSCYYQIRGAKLLKYTANEFISEKKKEYSNVMNDRKLSTYNGEMSHASIKNLRKKIEIWHDGLTEYNESIKEGTVRDLRKFVFITLTLSANQIHSDQEIKKLLLKPFIRKLRDNFKVDNYIWKAESQQNGRIHFHLIIDKYIDKQVIQNEWNRCQNALGYIDTFFKEFKHRNAPSTRIELAYNKSHLMHYFEKYICKSDQYRKIDGALWKASVGILSLQFFEFIADSKVDMKIDDLIQEKKAVVFSKDRYSVIVLRDTDIKEVISPVNYNKYLIYKYLLCCFLFYEPVVSSFRDYCYLFSLMEVKKEIALPEIAKKNYPIPVQLSINEFLDIVNFKKYAQ